MTDTIEEFLASLSDDEMVELDRQLGHAFSCYTLEGKHLPHPHEKENLLAVLVQQERYVVDGNSNWKEESKNPVHRNKAFVIGRTLWDEEYNLKGIYFSRKVDITNNNLFTLGIIDGANGHEKLMQIERIDAAYRSIFDEASLTEESKPKEKRTAPKFIERERERMEQIIEQKKVMLLILGIKDILQAENETLIAPKRKQLAEIIKKAVPSCLANYGVAVETARFCYALLLTNRKDIRQEFSDQAYRNVFGDMLALLDALFLGANILSGDTALGEMAGYAGIKCVRELEPTRPR
jgi:hypothetical protein